MFVHPTSSSENLVDALLSSHFIHEMNNALKTKIFGHEVVAFDFSTINAKIQKIKKSNLEFLDCTSLQNEALADSEFYQFLTFYTVHRTLKTG